MTPHDPQPSYPFVVLVTVTQDDILNAKLNSDYCAISRATARSIHRMGYTCEQLFLGSDRLMRGYIMYHDDDGTRMAQFIHCAVPAHVVKLTLLLDEFGASVAATFSLTFHSHRA